MLDSNVPASPLTSRRFIIFLALILVAKAALQSVLFIGLTRGEYPEEGRFLELAINPLTGHGGFQGLLVRYKEAIDLTKIAITPPDMYKFRVSALAPNQLFVWFFGISERSVCLWTIICGHLTVIFVALLGYLLKLRRAGLYAAIALSLIPSHIVYTGRLNTDIPLFAFILLSLLFVVRGLAKPSYLSFILAGLSCGLVYLAKLPSGHVVCILLILISFFALKEEPLGRRFKLTAILFTSYLSVVLIENLVYLLLTGHWWLHRTVISGNSFNIPSWRNHSLFFDFGPVAVWIYQSGWSGLFEHAVTAFGSNPGGVYNWPLFGASVWALIFSLPIVWTAARRDRTFAAVMIFFLLYYLYIEVGCFYPQLQNNRLEITFYHKNHRYFIPCFGGVALAIGLLFDKVHSFFKPRACFFVMATLWAAFALSGVSQTAKVYYILKQNMTQIRDAVEFVKNLPDHPKRILVEPIVRTYVTTLFEDSSYKIENLSPKNADSCDGIVAFGFDPGFSSPVLGDERFRDSLPQALSDYWTLKSPIPPGFSLIYENYHPLSQNPYPLRILRMPPCPGNEHS